jgi:glycosyltransferase involved in cell wall biosynthesis
MSTFHKVGRAARHISNMVSRLPAFAAERAGIHFSPQWVCIAEQEGWSIAEDAKFVSGQLKMRGIKSSIVLRPDLISKNILHYCSLHTYGLRRRAWAAEQNKHVLTCFHGDLGIDTQMDEQLRQVLKDSDKLDALIVSCTRMKRRFLSWGMPEDKIHLIPLSIDPYVFRPDSKARAQVRRELGIPSDAIVVGSFQKDGVGHEEGIEPKMIKGPDHFCDVVVRLSRSFPVVALLTGPARGYVKNRLKREGVRYIHRHVDTIKKVARYYCALDLYLMTSREEGGPKSVLESLASGTPFVGTDVGMVGDIVIHGANGWVCSVGDLDALFEACKTVILDEGAKRRVQDAGLETILSFSPDVIGQRYADLYRKIAQQPRS